MLLFFNTSGSMDEIRTVTVDEMGLIMVESFIIYDCFFYAGMLKMKARFL